ncbi:MAG: HNH endonuclease [Verrucomicrobiota bacterium]
MNTYLLVWNPKHWDWKFLAEESEKTARDIPVAGEWSCANRRVRAGDRLFLIRVGSEPKGIMASGWAKGDVEMGLHYKSELAAACKERPYIEFDFERIINPELDPPLDVRKFRDDALRDVHWFSQSSGILIPAVAATELEHLWETHIQTMRVQSHNADSDEGVEGSVSLKLVRHRKRETKLRADKVAQFMREHANRLFCEVPGCGFDFEKRYGAVGRGYAQVHHRKPLSDYSAPSVTKLSDLVIVCANCHAMIHRHSECRPIESLITRVSNGS